VRIARSHDAHVAAVIRLAAASQEFAKLPWEVSMTKEQAAKVLGSYLGVPDLPPATVLALTTDQTHGILEATTTKGNKELEKALFSYADSVTNRFFSEQVFYRGIVEFSNVCQNDCGYCGIRKHQPNVQR
jgi:biotin synthase